MSITVPQSKALANATSGSFTSNVTAGNTVFIVVCAFNATGNAISTSNPTFGGSGVSGTLLAEAQGTNGANAGYTAIWMLPNLAGGAASVGITLTNGSVNAATGIIIYEVAGLGSTPALDAKSTGSGSSTTAVSSGASPNISFAPEFVLGAYMSNSASNNGPPGAPWTSTTVGSNLSGAGYQIPASTGSSYTFSSTATGGVFGWGAAVVTVYTPPPPLARAIRARQQQSWKGRCYSAPALAAQAAPVPTQGPVFRQAVQAIAAKLPTRQVPVPGPGLTGNVSSELAKGTGNIPGPVTWRGGGTGASGATVKNPAAGPVFTQAVRPCGPRIPQNIQPTAERVNSNPGSTPRNPTQGPVFRQAVQAARARLPLQPLLRGRCSSNPGAPVRNPSPGPVFTPAVQAARARLPQQPLLRGRTAGSRGAPVRNPSSGPVFEQAITPAQARIPQVFSKGRATSNPGAPARNPTAGPVFRQATSPARIRPSLPPRGRTGSNPGGPVQNPSPVTTGPPFRQATSPARIRPSLPPRGRTGSNPGGPVRNPHQGAAFPAPHGPVQARLPQQPFLKGRIASSLGAPVVNPSAGPRFTPAVEALRARLPVPFLKGRATGSPGAPVRNPSAGPVIPQAGQPVRARTPLPPRGRIGSNPGIPVAVVPVFTGPAFTPRHDPARIRPSLPPRGRVSSNPGAPVRNPRPGPVFTQKPWPCRAVIPQNAPRGRAAGNPGGPVANIPFGNPLFRLGTPYFQWNTGTPGFQWETGTPVSSG